MLEPPQPSAIPESCLGHDWHPRKGERPMTGSTALWYASRATGIVCLLLLTAVLVLGIMVNRHQDGTVNG